MTARLVWGSLATDQGLAQVLGRVPAGQAGRLPGFALARDPASSLNLLCPAPGPGPGAPVLRLPDLAPAEARRLDDLAQALGASRPLSGLDALGWHAAALPQGAGPDELAPWLFAEILSWLDQGHAPQALAGRRAALAVLAASRQRAATGAPPTTLRRRARPEDLKVTDIRHPYAGFFAVHEARVAWRRFDGSMGAPVPRAVFLSGDAVTVLPYDPARDRVLVVEQFRAGPLARGDAQPWQIEAIAGRIDPGETPEAAARREAVEEAGLTLGALHFIARYYPSPGAYGEYLYSYLALADLPDGAAGTFGLAEEAEDIRGHLIGFDRLMGLVATGEVENAPLILTAQWLAAHRARWR